MEGREGGRERNAQRKKGEDQIIKERQKKWHFLTSLLTLSTS